MKNLLLLFVIGLVLLALARAAFPQDSEPEAAISSPQAEQSPAGIYAAGNWRTGLSLGMASALGKSYTSVGAGVGYYPIDGLDIGANVRGWLSSAPSILEITPEVRYVAWQLPGLKPYAGAFYRWNQSRDVVTANSYGGRLGVLYNKRNSRLYMGAGAVWEQLSDCRAAGLSNCSVLYPEFFLSAGPIKAVATRALPGLRP